ncbi:hypothetical protein, partial [Xanthomonas phaseoli]|uniref:hypothetical protein n=1 Tax=Xanthomonas phaseoli TaxID=1985254 RepID=UPI0019553017
LGLLEDGDDLAVGETGCLHGTSSEKGTRKFHFWRQLTCGGITQQGGSCRNFPTPISFSFMHDRD